MPIIYLEHRSTKPPRGRVISIDLSADRAAAACVYLHLLRAELPQMRTVEEELGEAEVADLLVRLYGARHEPIDLAGAAEQRIELYALGVHHPLHRLDSPHAARRQAGQRYAAEHDVTSIPRPGAKRAILEHMAESARSCAKCDPHAGAERDLDRIAFIAAGGSVPAQWGLHDFSRSPYTGTIGAADSLDWPKCWASLAHETQAAS